MDEQNYYSTIPTELLECGKPTKAVLYGIITSYARKNGRCWASNSTLAKRIGVKSDKTVSRYIQELIKEKWINSEIVVTEGNRRYLSIGRVLESTTYGTTEHEGSGTVEHTSNISISNIKSNKYTNVYVETLKNVYDLYCKLFDKNPNTYKLTDKRKLKLKARLKDIGEEQLIKAITNTSASNFHRGDNDRGWQADLDWIIKSYEQVEKLASMEKRSGSSFVAKDGTILSDANSLRRYEEYQQRLKETK